MGFRDWLLERLGGGEPSWVVVCDTSPEQGAWIVEHLRAEGVVSEMRRADRPTARKVLGLDSAPVVWVVVLEPDQPRAEQLLAEWSD